MFNKFILAVTLAIGTSAIADGAQVSNASAKSTTFSHDTGSYRLTLSNFAYNVPTWTTALLLNPAINTNYVRVYSPDCHGMVSAYAKSNVPEWGYYTLNPMTFQGNATWYYDTTPIRVMQILETQTQWYPIAPTCELVIEPVHASEPTQETKRCLSLEEGQQLQLCTVPHDLSCQILNKRFRTYGLCN